MCRGMTLLREFVTTGDFTVAVNKVAEPSRRASVA